MIVVQSWWQIVLYCSSMYTSIFFSGVKSNFSIIGNFFESAKTVNGIPTADIARTERYCLVACAMVRC